MTFKPDDAQKSHWRKVRSAFDPWHRSTPEEIGGLYAERPESPSGKLAEQFDLLAERQYVRAVLCGARGAGKSTELARLHQLMDERFAVLPFDLDGALPEGTGALALIAVINVLAEAAVRFWSDPEAEETLALAHHRKSRFDGAMSRLKIGTETVAEVIKAAAPWLKLLQGTTPVPDGTAETAQAVSTGLTVLNQLLARMVADAPALRAGAHPQHRADADELILTTNASLAALRDAAGKPALFLLDGLDRTIKLDAVKGLFRDMDLLRRLDMNLVLCSPIAVRHEPALRAVAHEVQTVMLDNVPIRHNDATHSPNEAGLALLADIYRRRCALWGLEEAIVDPAALRDAALMSAGLVRDFLDLLWRASAAAAFDPGQRISRPLMDAAIGEKRRLLQGFLKHDRTNLLLQVLRSQEWPEGPVADELLFENFIACYSNGDVWFRPHELLVDWLERRHTEAAAHERAAEAARGE